MKEKTAMQMLIEAMQKDYESINGYESYLVLRITQAKSFLRKEREQIEKAFCSGYLDGIGEDVGLDTGYYSSKYGDE